MRKTDVLKNAQDFIVIGQFARDSYVYASKPSFGTQKQLYEQSISNPNDKNVDVFDRCWKFDEQQGIKGSNTFLALRFDKMALRPYGLWIPGLLEAKVLDKQGKLENGVYRDYGVAVYDEQNPNQEMAQRLVPQAQDFGLQLPLIVPFRALDYNPNGNQIDVSFVQSPQGIIQGKDAQRNIDSLNYKGNSGVQGLSRSWDGYWFAIWYRLDFSDDVGRVDWVCGEATRKILEHAYSELNERNYGKQIQTLKEKQKADKDNFRKSLKR